jgi:hypothetical protein
VLSRIETVAKLIAAAMLLAALARHRYDYYTLLRWVVCGVAAFAAFRAGTFNKGGWVLALAIVALVFNPVVPVHLTRETWAFIDVGTAVLLAASVMSDRQPTTV